MSHSAYWCTGPTLSLASPARGFAAEMVTVSRRPWLFRVPHGFIKTVARCVRCFQRCFMRYFVTVQNAQASFSTSPAGAGWIHVLNILFAYLGAPADTRSNLVKRSLWQFAVICLLIGNGKISKCFCCTVSRSILLRKKLEQQFETSGGDECDWPGPRNGSWAARARKTERWRTGVTGGLIDFLDLRWKVLDKHRGGLYLWGWCDLHPPPAVHEVHWLMLANAG